MADMKISELSSVASLNNGDLIEVSQVDSSSPTGYSSMKASMLDVGEKVVNEIQYIQELDTSAKKITGAINELVGEMDEKATIVDLGRLDNATKTITFSSTVRFLICSFGGSDSRLGSYIAFGRATTSFVQPLLTSSVVTVTPNDNTIAISTSTTNVYISLVILSGSPSDFVIT